jgi:hypothetical protein
MTDLLLERAGELAAIEKAIRMARAGCGRRLLISGPPGSGRTTLLERARSRAMAQGLPVLEARGEERERGFPFALARRLLAFHAVLPAGYEALLELNRALARRAPVLVTVDDLEDCDSASRDWLAFAARRLSREAIALVVAGELARFEDAMVLPLRPFSERAVAALLHVELGRSVDAASARACHIATAGQPLLVCELAAASRRGQPESVPPGVTWFLRRRLLPLPRSARMLAGAIALLDGSATLHDAAALSGLGPDHAAAAADRLRAAGLLVGDELLAIAPPLLARALYDGIPPARRALWHARAARRAARSATAVGHLLRSAPSRPPLTGRSTMGGRRRPPSCCVAPIGRAWAIAERC